MGDECRLKDDASRQLVAALAKYRKAEVMAECRYSKSGRKGDGFRL